MTLILESKDTQADPYKQQAHKKKILGNQPQDLKPVYREAVVRGSIKNQSYTLAESLCKFV